MATFELEPGESEVGNVRQQGWLVPAPALRGPGQRKGESP